jgi:S1-C subfamily serine protease
MDKQARRGATLKVLYTILTLLHFGSLFAGTAYTTMGPVVKVESSVGTGTAFAISEGAGKTVLVTNWHVVRDDKKVVIKAFFWNKGRTKILAWYKLEGKVLSTHEALDLVLLTIPSVFEIPVARLSDAHELEILTAVLAVGCGLGEDVQIYRGVIIDQEWDSPTDSHSQNLIQTDCFIQPGVSGGPLWEFRNGRWQVIGIMCRGFRGTSMTFALPISRLIKLGKVTK